ncbi:MAG TPA: LOG family protein, partial [Halioglobus sp.]
FIVAPGGIGTVLEAMMIWQLLQVRHLDAKTPLIFVGKMWPGLVDWARTAMVTTDQPLASATDMDIPQCVENAEQAIALIRTHHARWASTVT